MITMFNNIRLSAFVYSIFLFFFVFVRPAHAYLDAGTGSVLFQFFLATIFGGLVALQAFWSKIKNFFSKLLFKKSPSRKNGK